MDHFPRMYHRRTDSDLDQYASGTCVPQTYYSDTVSPPMALQGSPLWRLPPALHNQFSGVDLPMPVHENMAMFSMPMPNAHHIDFPTQRDSYDSGGLWPFAAPPSESGQCSTCSDSSSGDSQSPPYLSPFARRDTFSSESSRMDNSVCHDNYYRHDDRPFMGETSYVAPQDVHNNADDQIDTGSFEEDNSSYQAYITYAQEGFAPMKVEEEGYMPMKAEDDCDVPVDTPAMTMDDAGSSCTEHASESPNIHRRQISTQHSKPSLTTNAHTIKVAKRGHHNRKPKRSGSRGFIDILPKPERAFLCPFAIYGCESSFKSKNEWKRHINTQHMRLSLWRCDQCPPRERPNEFNRKDLFIQHVRRMHWDEPQLSAAPIPRTSNKPVAAAAKQQQASKNKAANAEEAKLNQAAERCHRRLRQAPELTCCLICTHTFHGSKTWDERLEHIGQHMEAMKRGEEDLMAPAEWIDDNGMEAWLLREKVIVHGRNGLVLNESKA